ncbi:transmembrane protein, putative [Bodo saltans]|uniref:Transmembrane protein, putative n=1 Tax=Bodo saltans TaxID=75058 RepID=A0A0S4IRV5_BODSA|nr:transmembrane protein, putative [Bodo saltans]|eukprot:CUF50774.1 transmembrane protein, putative [Bodo saltans]
MAGRARSRSPGRKNKNAVTSATQRRSNVGSLPKKVEDQASTQQRKSSSPSSNTPHHSSVNYSFVLYAMLAGAFGALSGVAGKLSVTDSVALAVYFRVATFIANGFCTAQMWRYYLKALSLGSTPTCQVINTATNFIVSAAVGFAVFGEEVNSLWCLGATLVVCGLGLIVSDPGVPTPS